MKKCLRGHLMTTRNTWLKKCKDGYTRTLCRACERIRNNRIKLELKIEVLSHYGKDEKLQCCWPGCEVNDIDVLTLDHVNDDGAKHRRSKGYGQGGGSFLYWEVRKLDFPKGYQTLCCNHQWKKEILRRRNMRFDEE
jgi:hypothetical protein